MNAQRDRLIAATEELARVAKTLPEDGTREAVTSALNAFDIAEGDFDAAADEYIREMARRAP